MFLYLLLSALFLCYIFIKKRHSYWRDRGVPYIEPHWFYGNINRSVGVKLSAIEYQNQLYNKFKEKGEYAGIYNFIQPVIFAIKPNFIKTILVKEFNNFSDRGGYYNEKDDPISAHMFAVDTHLWRNLRTKLTPTFTSGKMRFMFPTIVSVANELENFLTTKLNESNKNIKEIELKDILARFTTDVIGTCAFGLECNSLKDPESEFRKMGTLILKPTKPKLVITFMIAFRKLAQMLRMKLVSKSISDFFYNIVKSTIEYREKNNIHRKDFMDLLINLKNSGNLDGSNIIKKENMLTLDQIVAQSFVFFIAGFETSSSAMTYTLYELAKNQEIQDRAREEIKRVYEKYDMKWTYEAMLELKYIDQIINETLRKYPPVPSLSRRITKNFKDTETNVVLEKGTFVQIPIYSIHRDPQYFPDPEKYDPERFSEEHVKTRDPYVHLPFGAGPRNCIGLRFGMMQSRIGLATILMKFKFTTSENTVEQIRIKPNSFLFASVGGIYVNIEEI